MQFTQKQAESRKQQRKEGIYWWMIMLAQNAAFISWNLPKTIPPLLSTHISSNRCFSSSSSFSVRCSNSCSVSQRPLRCNTPPIFLCFLFTKLFDMGFVSHYLLICRYAVLGAGFAGLSVAWNLLLVLYLSLSLTLLSLLFHYFVDSVLSTDRC